VLRHGVASPDGSTLYITGTSDGISQLSAATLAVERGYSSAGTPQNVDVHEDGSRVYVGLGTDAILVITTSTGLTRPIVFSGAMSTYGVALVEAIGRGYVTDEDGGGVHVFDLQSEAEIPSEYIDLGAGSRPRAIVGS
jgi:DNA-binding beta-propeller fold protein YncE